MIYTRHYILLDQGTQWVNKLCRVEQVITPSSNGPVTEYRSPRLTDLPREVRNSAFLDNVYGREMKDSLLRLENETWGAWSISEEEVKRIQRMIDLVACSNEFAKLAAYP